MASVSVASSAAASGAAASNPDVNVTREDQSKINRFSCLNMRVEELIVERKSLEKDSEHLDEALGEIILADGDDKDAVSLAVGECFLRMGTDEAQEWLEARKKELSDKMAAITGRIDVIKEEMQGLKVELYKKFGTNINLESDD